jgi:hypothetical protein
VDLHEKLPHESMHSNSFGLTVEFVDSIVPYAKEMGLTVDIATIVDARIWQMPRYA